MNILAAEATFVVPHDSTKVPPSGSLPCQGACVSDSEDDADAASFEADRRRPTDDLDQRPAWERDGYPDEDTARATIERVNDLLRSVDTERRAPVRRWLSAHAYPPAIPVPVRAADTAVLEALINDTLETVEHTGASSNEG